jgi:homoserine O-acetyltransferase/O-succinyltransferase
VNETNKRPLGRYCACPPESNNGRQVSGSQEITPRGPLPVTGAFDPADDPGDRQLLHLPHARAFSLEGGGVLWGVTLAYETWGELNADASNAVLVCHALTGDSHAFGERTDAHPTAGWWNGVVGPGCPIDTDTYFVVCVNVLGGCQGTTGPASVNPLTHERYGSTFPVVSIRDIVRTQAEVADHLGIAQWLAVVGGSMGGMQALEWSLTYPSRLRGVAVIASAVAASAQQIAWSMVGRRAVSYDPAFNGGDYYDAPAGGGPHSGLMVARALAMVHYRSEQEFQGRFGRRRTDVMDNFAVEQRFQVESYLDYQAEKLVRRFDANTYVILNKAMDMHDVGRGRGGLQLAMSRAVVPAFVVGISSDSLYPVHQQTEIRDLFEDNGLEVDFQLVDSPNGHDGFLIDADQFTPGLEQFLRRRQKEIS